jgi:hypothetical protein
MGKEGYVKKGKVAVSGLFEITATTTPETLHPTYTAATIAFVDSNPDTITDTANKFLLKGFHAGDKIRVSGSVSNNKVFTIATVVAGTITLVAGDALTAELAGASVTITKEERVYCRDITIQVPSTNTSTKLAIARSSSVDLTTERGFVLAKLNTFTYQGVYLDEIYVDVGTNADKVYYEYTPVL